MDTYLNMTVIVDDVFYNSLCRTNSEFLCTILKLYLKSGILSMVCYGNTLVRDLHNIHVCKFSKMFLATGGFNYRVGLRIKQSTERLFYLIVF